MPRVKQVVAAKDYPKFGIVKGQKHYYWKRKTGPRSSQEYRQVDPPRIEQLTGSAYKIAIHNIGEAITKVTGPDDIDDVKNMVEELAAEQREKFENMPEGLQQGDTGQTLEQQADALDAAAEEFGTVQEEWTSAISDYDDEMMQYESEKSEYETQHEEYDAEWQRWNNDEDADENDEPEEPEEPHEPEEVDAEDFLSRLSDIQLES